MDSYLIVHLEDIMDLVGRVLRRGVMTSVEQGKLNLFKGEVRILLCLGREIYCLGYG